jgi:cell division protein FtsZ
MLAHTDTLIDIALEQILAGREDLTFVEAFRTADDAMLRAVKGISDLLTLDAVVNVEFEDVRTVMSGGGRAGFGTGQATGERRARLAAEQAVTSASVDAIAIDGASSLLINVMGGPDMKMREIQEAASAVQERSHENANIIFGASIDESMSDSLIVTVIAAGYGLQAQGNVSLASKTTPLNEASVGASEREPTTFDDAAESLSLFFDMATISANKAGLVIRALEKVLGTELKIVRTRPLPPGKTGPRSSNDSQHDTTVGL